jgi:hypothetical protein
MMAPNIYRFEFVESVSMVEVEETLMLAIIATESLHGESQARLDIEHEFSVEKRTCAINATTSVGADLNRLFVGFVTREFGAGAFQVERVGAQPELTTA